MNIYEKVSDAITAAKENFDHDTATNHKVVLAIRRPTNTSWGAFFTRRQEHLSPEMNARANEAATLAYEDPQEIIRRVEVVPHSQNPRN